MHPPPPPPHLFVMDIFFPGFTGLTVTLQQLLNGTMDGYAASRADVYDPDEAYDMLDAWVSGQAFSQDASSSLVTVESRRGRSMAQLHPDITAKKNLRFTPWGEPLYFWYRGHRLTLRCTQDRASLFPRNTMTVSCVGRSSQVLRDLMEECRVEYLKYSENKTSIFENYNNGWKRTTTRDLRPIDTVIMNEQLKQTLLKDVHSFLDPKARSWYASRGLPYRRGYLLFGRPGTGKSSLSMSVAGCFGLDIYVLSLAAMSDGQLSALFRELPQRCVVLLEDVDAVGTTQSRVSDADDFDSRSEDSRRSSKSHGAVSLSGLLNVLDGVASQEGRVLIMTTNHIEHLDEALIRSGRVDKKIEFQLADADVTRKIFNTVFQQSEEELSDLDNREDSNEEVRRLAGQFAALVPELEFSPADIFSFLLANRDSPSGALAEVEGWVSRTREERALRRGDSWLQSD
ncbi:mitochondrial chaperone bcs1 [Colletotrichum tamarilloi]|uniref:Mitochondrial chaperone bcs1 n=1 Tax=Colletotrichum tamarilloi TaxID=1209934 RepID=A0ABQ9QH83_9PEZI|nr:mitochondrial chaperone bcs1 [Colletotrichum tamarilloi]KAK1470230.1 mitochondrial chaperone bcs1 [Colletotrichum tamarilloi]